MANPGCEFCKCLCLFGILIMLIFMYFFPSGVSITNQPEVRIRAGIPVTVRLSDNNVRIDGTVKLNNDLPVNVKIDRNEYDPVFVKVGRNDSDPVNVKVQSSDYEPVHVRVDK